MMIRRFKQTKPITLMLVCLTIAITGCHRSAPPRSLLIITLDTLRADHLGCYGNPLIHTPNLDRLAQQGQQWSQAMCQTPLTVPSHAAIFTSRTTWDLRVLANTNSLPETETTLAEHLKRQGFSTAGFTSGILMFPRGLEQGLDHIKLRKSGAQSGPVTTMLRKPGETAVTEDKMHPSAKKLVDEAIGWLDGHPADRSMVWLHCFDPHMPYNPAPPIRNLYASEGPIDDEAVKRLENPLAKDYPPEDLARIRQLYAAEVAYLDQHVGRLIRKVRSDEYPPLIVVTADHGEMFLDEHGYTGHGSSLHAQEIHIPLIMNDRADEANTGLHPDVVESIDIVPTLLAWMKLPPMPTAEGRDLKAAKGNGSQTPMARFCRRGFESGVMRNDFKLIHDLPGQQWESFDLAQDPQEMLPSLLSEEQMMGETHADAETVRAIDAKNHGSDDLLDGDLQDALKALGYL